MFFTKFEKNKRHMRENTDSHFPICISWSTSTGFYIIKTTSHTDTHTCNNITHTHDLKGMETLAAWLSFMSVCVWVYDRMCPYWLWTFFCVWNKLFLDLFFTLVHSGLAAVLWCTCSLPFIVCQCLDRQADQNRAGRQMNWPCTRLVADWVTSYKT